MTARKTYTQIWKLTEAVKQKHLMSLKAARAEKAYLDQEAARLSEQASEARISDTETSPVALAHWHGWADRRIKDHTAAGRQLDVEISNLRATAQKATAKADAAKILRDDAVRSEKETAEKRREDESALLNAMKRPV